MGIISLANLTACSRTAKDDENVAEMQNGQVVEIEGPQDQYGWFPHMRLTFDGEVLSEVYFDYVDDSSAKKSQDEEYNATMQEKTGMSAKDAMETLRKNLLETQSPEKVDIVTGATQTSTEFIEMAKQAFDNYQNGKTSANNYGEPKDENKNNEQQSKEGSEQSVYTTGGDGNPNSQGSSQETSQDAVPVVGE